MAAVMDLARRRRPAHHRAVDGRDRRREEVVARDPPRRPDLREPFLAVNLASVDAGSREQLFRHERDAFTGADGRRRHPASRGRGTAFLDGSASCRSGAGDAAARHRRTSARPVGSDVAVPFARTDHRRTYRPPGARAEESSRGPVLPPQRDADRGSRCAIVRGHSGPGARAARASRGAQGVPAPTIDGR